MSKSSCISHAPRQQMVMIRQDYLQIADNNHCAAALLNIFEYWHNIKLGDQEQTETENEIARAGDAPPVTADLWVYKAIPDLQAELLGLFGANKIGDALKLLVKKGFLATRNNPKYGWDRTLQYLFNVEIVQASISNLPSFRNKASTSVKNKASRAPKVKDRSPENKAALPETPTEITTEIKDCAPSGARPENSDSQPVKADIQEKANGVNGKPKIETYIKAYEDGLTTKPIRNQYRQKGNRTAADDLLKSGIHPTWVMLYTRKLSGESYWKGRKPPLTVVTEGISAWLGLYGFDATQPPPTKPVEPEIDPADVIPIEQQQLGVDMIRQLAEKKGA